MGKLQNKLPISSLTKKGGIINNKFMYKKKPNNQYRLEAGLIKANKKFKYFYENSNAK